MRIFLNILAVLLLLVGVVWFLQGINVLLGSVMTGQSQWAIIGGIAFLAGIALLILSNRRKSSPPQSNP
jgi:LPXTG-motif cell wall-anchored protein